MNNKTKMILLNIVLPVMIALGSILFSQTASSVSFHQDDIAYLDAKRNSVLGMTALSTATSVGITALPGDAGTSVANELADLSSKFILVLGAIYLEKYLLTITGFVAFKMLIPVACGLVVFNFFKNSKALIPLAMKLVFISVAMFLVVPSSVYISKMIENTYSDSVQEIMNEGEKAQEEEDKNIIQNFVEGITGVVSGAVEKAGSALNNFIEAIAVMIVTSCVIPILVILFFVWGIKQISGLSIDVGRLNINPTKKINGVISKKTKES